MAPKLTAQIPTIHIDSDKLGAGEMKYNASIIKHEGKTLLAYRLHPSDRWQCRIHIAELNDAGKVIKDYALDVPEPTHRSNVEDPRLFHFRSQLWMGWTEAVYHEHSRKWTCIQKYGRIEGRKIIEHYSPKFGQNDGTKKEKNWTFFDYQGRLMACYKHAPQVVIELEGEKVINQWTTKGAPWGWGYPSGGTPPILVDDKYLTFFHSYEAHDKYPRKYFAGALTFDAHPPFEIRDISAIPICEGTDEERTRTEGWTCLVVFPCGAIEHGEGYRVSIGVNDMSIALIDVTEMNLLTLGKPRQNKNQMRIKLIQPVAIKGSGKAAGEILELPTPIARDLIARRRAVELPELTVETTPKPITAPTPKAAKK